jgi:pullulanase
MDSNTKRALPGSYRAFFLALLACCYGTSAFASHSSPPVSVALVGSLQSELGCPGDWQPECAATELFDNGTIWVATFVIPAGNWEYKVALNDNWGESYGDNGNNVSLSLASATSVTFTYDHVSHEVSDNAPLVQPASVTIVGSLQSELGCGGDWDPSCSAAFLGFDPDDAVWQSIFSVPAGNWEYKATLNGTWDENYGRNAERDGANIALNLGGDADVKFYYDHASHWVTDNQNSVIAVTPGSFQSEIGCPGDWQPDCLRSWLQDADGDGSYSFATRDIPAGNYEVKVAHDESWNENYGADGVQNGANLSFSVPNSGDLVVFSYDPVTHILDIGGELPKGNISEARAYWLAEDTLAWNVPAGNIVRLHYSHDASLAVTAGGLAGGDSIELTPSGVVDGEVADKFRHLAGLPTYQINGGDLALIGDILKQQFAVAAVNADNEPVDATGVQPAGVLDDLYTYGGDLGVTFDGDTPTVRVWAPTARSVNLHLFDDSNNANGASAVLPMIADAATGTWSLQGDASWNRKYFLYEVEVYARSAGQIVNNLVTDPYSHSLSMDSKRTQIVNLSDSDLKPRHWDRLRKPKLKEPEDIALYEMHVRDFSMHDTSVPEDVRGTFKAFSLKHTRGTKHLKKLSRAGMTHAHLLPSFDCASVPEDRSTHATPGDLSIYAPDGVEQQEAIDAIRDQDGFNWCYDPYHFTAPEGSYATDPDGAARILEFREMVAGLNHTGLRVVMDVVYNHTSGSLQGEKSVLDKVVPDYYHRLNDAGSIESSSCCSNTATEHNMMEKLMLDSLRTWAIEYKIDGFRFDLMGHHSRANIENARDMLHSLTKKSDGIDGNDIYLYGEGWKFGEVANDARFVQATQINMGDHSGVGTFNDRLRDGVRGGGPFDSGVDHVRRQGFVNGMYFDPNSENSGSEAELDELLRLTDWIRIGLAGSIADYQFIDRFGNLVQAKDVDYAGQGGAGYTSDPQEVINYAASHDNETLFDISQYKLPRATSSDDRVRVQNLGNSILALSQGIPLFHAGQDLLRSKSMDRNSFNSGDWFNILDFTQEQNGWGRGLPPFGDNSANWAEQQSLLADPSLAVDRHDIKRASKHMLEMLQIRKDSKLFRLHTGQDVMERIEFHNTGPNQVPGLIAMSIRGKKDIELVVLINASTESQEFFFDTGEKRKFKLHKIQKKSKDRVVRESDYDDDGKMFHVPARTAAVFEAHH